MPRHNATRRIPPLRLVGAVALAAACGAGDAVEPRPDPPSNRAPTIAAAIPDQALIAGQTITADVAGAFTDPDGDPLTYAARSSNAGVATAALAGTELSLTGVAPGAAAITLTTTDPGGLSASQSFAVDVVAPTPTGLTITPATAAFTAIGQTAQLSVDMTDQFGQPIPAPAVVWSSADGSVASVDASGLVTAAGNGETTVTAISGAASGSARLTVDQVAASVAVSPAADTLTALGDTLRLTAEAVDANGHAMADAEFTWSTTDASVVTVDARGSGLVTAAGNGEATVTASSGAVSGSARLTVGQRAASVTISPSAATLTALGDTVRLRAEAADANGRVVAGVAFTWSSADASVVTVDARGSGLVTAVGNGEATVTANSGAVSGSARLTVDQRAASVAVSPTADTLTALGDTVRLTAEAADANGHAVAGIEFTWFSADESVVAVDEAGLATAVANGNARVTAVSGTGADTASGAASLVVSQRAEAVNVSPATAALAPGDTVRLTATATDANGHAVAGAAFDWTSSAATIATVDDAGLVRARAEGTTTVTAASDGAEGTATVTVDPPQPPPDLGGAYTLESIVGAATGGVVFTHPAASGTLELTQDPPSGASATGHYTVNVTTPLTTITDQGTFTVHADGRWTQTGQVSGEGTYAVSGDSLTITITEPATAASTTVWVRGYPPTPGMWRGLVVAPETRCSEYDVGDYEHSDSILDVVIRGLDGKLYEPYTGIYYDYARQVQVDHIIAKGEAHDSGACAWKWNDRRAFANDIENIALASPRLDRGVKADKDAAEWLPDFNQCWYANAVVAIRRKYELTIDEAERDALEGVLAGCDSAEMVFAPESWAVEAMTLGGEDGWRARSPHEPDDGEFGVVTDLSVSCTSTFTSVDFRFFAGGARLNGSEENYEAGPLRYSTRVSAEWAVPLPSPLDMVTVHQDPRPGTWHPRLHSGHYTDFLAGLGMSGQRVWIIWPLPGGNATVRYEGGTDAGEKIRDILQRCADAPGR